MENLLRMDLNELHELYEAVDKIRAEELRLTKRFTKSGITRMRGQLSIAQRLCKAVRKSLLEMRDDGKVRCR